MPTSLQQPSSVHATAVWQPTSIQTIGLASGLTKSGWNSPWLGTERYECASIAWRDGRARSEVAKDHGTLYIVSGNERHTFCNLAEFI